MTDLPETRVVHKDRESYDIYIGRGSLFGNPFSHRPSAIPNVVYVGNRQAAIDRYRVWLTTDEILRGWRKPTQGEILGLLGKRLGCSCRPASCHGDVLVDLIARWSVGL